MAEQEMENMANNNARDISISQFNWRESDELLAELEERRQTEFCIIKSDETAEDALQRMDPDLFSNRSGNSFLPPFLTTTIPKGRIGCGSIRSSEPLFFKPGTYWWLGFGVSWNDPKVRSLTEQKIINKTVSIITLTDSDGAVVKEGSNLITLGKGRYIIREPLKLEQVFSDSDFTPHVKKRTTVGGNVETSVLGRIIGGRNLGCKFIQVSPGCCAVVQVGSELIVFYEGLYRLKSLEDNVVRWLDLREVSDTVLNIRVSTSNQAQMTVTVNIRCRLDKPIEFTKACEYNDMQDALDDKAIDVLQNLVGSRTYETIIQAVDEGEKSFDTWLSEAATKVLQPYAEGLGGELLELSVVKRSFDQTIQYTLDRQAEHTLELETRRLNMEKSTETQKREAEAAAERKRIDAEGNAEATRIESRANRDKIEQEAIAKAKAAQEIADAYSNIKDEFARDTLKSQGQLKKFEAIGDKAMIIPSDLSLNAGVAATNTAASNLALRSGRN
eukprot:gb/GECH01011540.1/.p1 GENE.gb/GECH01011540.1/~~gb/GECH01011540.1/.p1  ORF type:complete len:501 (+),score=147.83 gb/GECH01011540.1/:1-1503(+)